MKTYMVIVLLVVFLLVGCGTEDRSTVYRITCYQSGQMIVDELVTARGGGYATYPEGNPVRFIRSAGTICVEIVQ
jgi:hypothetical protein